VNVSAWSYAWGNSWGNSWGLLDDGSGGGGGSRRLKFYVIAPVRVGRMMGI
jgi:hypothetical protein